MTLEETLKEARVFLSAFTIFVLLLLIPLMVKMNIYMHQKNLMQNGTAIEASIWVKKHRKSTSGMLSYTYNEQHYEKEVLDVPKESVPGHSTITIYIDPNNPDDYCIQPNKSEFITICVFFAAGCVAIVIVWTIGLIACRKKKLAALDDRR